MKCKNCDSMEIHAKGLCRKCYSKAYREANKDKISARHKLYYEANKDEFKAYRETNKDKIKLYYEANKDEISAQRKAHYETNKDEINERNKLYYEANKDEINERNKLYYEATRDPNSARMGSEEYRIKNSCGQQGIDIEDFDGFTTEQKYCPGFNNERRKKNREKYNNCDYISGIHKDICNKGRSLDVHHVDYNKQQGCNDHEWALVPLSRSNHMKTNTNRSFWNKLFMYSLEIDKCYYEVELNHYC